MYGNDEDRESDYEDFETEIFSPSFKPSYVVIAIDTHPAMFQKKHNAVTPFRSCLESCYNLAESLIFRQDKRSWSPFAIKLTGESSPLISFDNSILDNLKILNAKIQLSDAELQQDYQRTGKVDLGGFFLSCKKMFHEIKSVFYKRTLIYISNDDKPIEDKVSKFTALNEIKTFIASQIEFQIIPTEQSFNYKYFYNELYSILGSGRHEEICTDTEGLTQKLSSTILVKVNERKVIFYPFKGDSGRFMKCLRVHIFSNIQLYNSFMTAKGERVVNTVVPNDQPQFFHIKYVSDQKSDNVKFEQVEKDSFQDFSQPKGLTLLFISDRQIGLGHIHSKPTLIKADPKEELPYFKKFWDNCVAANKVLICMSKVRQPDKVRYVELIPVLVDNQQMFLEKRLPYGNELVFPWKLEYPVEEEDEERKNTVKQLVDALTFEFDPKMIPDVAFLKKKAYVKAKLLDAPMEEVDELAINHQQLDEVLNDIVNDINEKFDLVVEEPKKRKTTYPGARGKRLKN